MSTSHNRDNGEHVSRREALRRGALGAAGIIAAGGLSSPVFAEPLKISPEELAKQKTARDAAAIEKAKSDLREYAESSVQRAYGPPNYKQQQTQSAVKRTFEAIDAKGDGPGDREKINRLLKQYHTLRRRMNAEGREGAPSGAMDKVIKQLNQLGYRFPWQEGGRRDAEVPKQI